MSFRDTKRNLRDIAHTLGVAQIVEGSVQRVGGRVRVNAQLIDARTDAHLWAERYDREPADVFSIQSEIAQSKAASLQAVISPEENARVQARPTADADAYVLYLRAREYQTRPTGLLQDYQTADRHYTQALALKPRFAADLDPDGESCPVDDSR
jgi:adenylate cyclase